MRLLLNLHSNPTVRLCDKNDPLSFESLLNFYDGGLISLNYPFTLLNPSNGGQANFGEFREILLSPS